VLPLGVPYAPNNAAISYSDYDTIAITATAATFKRSILDGQELAWVNPGARIRFQTNATLMLLSFMYNETVSRTDIYNGQGLILVNGVLQARFGIANQGAYLVPQPLQVLQSFPSSVSKLIDIVLPYGTAVAFSGVTVNSGATVTAAASPRPTTIYCAMGDSITQGLRNNTDISNIWTYGIATADNYQLVNMGYGGRICTASDGTNLGNISATLYSYLIGYNDFAAQESLATFAADYTSFINNFRALQATAKLYCITPTPTTTVLTIPIESYRQQIRNVLATLANSKNILVEGGSLWPNNTTYSPDGIHPNNLGSASMTAALAPILVP
jgi:lysophospholipase L1-like esterase